MSQEIVYGKKIEDILLDIEDSKIHIAGGSVVGMVLSIVNSLIVYISNLTIGKKSYKDVQSKIQEILKETKETKEESIKIIDKDKEILEQILDAYRMRKEDEERYQNVLKNAVKFCVEVVEIAYKTCILTKRISEVGNKMLASDFKICKYYSIASMNSAIENVYVNLEEITDIEFKTMIKSECDNKLKSINLYMNDLDE